MRWYAQCSALAMMAVFGFAAPASAQSSDTTAGAEDAGAIVVTARRVEERLQDVPISITVFNQQQLDNRNVFSAKDLATYTPSLSTNTRFGNDNASFAIRGFTQENRTTASVATYFADVVVPRGGGSTQAGDQASTGSFFDLQNVQVLKGPQGTLFGRNTTGGAVLLVPQKPTERFEGYLEGSYGNYNMRRLQGVINVPLAENFRIRAGVDWQKRDGYLKNISGIGPKRFADVDYVAARLSIVGDLTPDLENYTIASYSLSSPNGTIPKVTDCFSSVFPFGVLMCDQVTREGGASTNNVSNSLYNAGQRTEAWQVINTTTWRASDSVTVKNIASYAELRNNQHNDLFGALYVIPTVLRNAAGTINIPTGALAGRTASFVPAESPPSLDSNAQSTFTEEVQVQGASADKRLQWQGGVYFEQSNPLSTYGSQNPLLLSCDNSGNFQCTDVFARLLGAPSVGSMSSQLARTTFRNVALYAQGSYEITDKLKLTAGFRYTWDRTRSTATQVTYRFLAPNVPTGFCTDTTIRPGNLPITSPSDCQIALGQDSKAPTWLLGLDFKPTEDVLLYAKYARGYRQGATNPFSAPGFNSFGAEKVDTYEIGAKTTFQGAVSGSFNIAGFYNDFRDQQIQIGFVSSRNLASPNVGIMNVGKSRIYGAEVEATLNPFKGLNLSASYAYLNTKIVSASSPAIPAGSPFDTIILPTTGGPLAFTPKHKLSASLNYTLPLDESVGTVSFGATYSYNGKMLYTTTSAANLALLVPAGLGGITDIPSTQLVDLNLNWRNVAGQPFDASFFVTNLFNERNYLARNIQATSGFVSRYVSEPRMYGVRLRVRFGN